MIPKEITAFYNKYKQALYESSLRIVGDSFDAEEIVQMTIINYLRANVSKVSDEETEASLRRACVKASVDMMLKRRGLKVKLEKHDGSPECDRVLRALLQYEGYDVHEAAGLLNVNESVIMSGYGSEDVDGAVMTANDGNTRIPDGDDLRFENTWEALSRERIKFRSNLKRRKKPLWKVLAFPVIASVALIVCVRLLMRPIATEFAAQKEAVENADSLYGAIYGDYYRKVADITMELSVVTAYMGEEEAQSVMSEFERIADARIRFSDSLSTAIDSVNAFRKCCSMRLERLDNYVDSIKQQI
ncbi:MAG TPA: hypothetical protein IAC03_02370 [Candidatus Coprenecus pullistercoris]|nr:hypothetical protein [Candidatus Coprenecus pullistercoris]